MTRIIDTTLREGEQAVGVGFNLAAKKKIINGLVALGIDEIELGVASPEHDDLADLCRYTRHTYPKQPFSLWSRCRQDDIRWAARLKPSCLALSIPASDLHLAKKLAKDRRWAINELKRSIQLAISLGIEHVAIGLEDASRADMNFVKTLTETAAEAGAFRLRLADTVGIATPATIAAMLANIIGTDIDIGVHCHNDFGMATANTITALEHGASWADATILGLGERAGNSRLEEVVSFLVLRKKTATYNLSGLKELSMFVAHAAGRKISPSKPIIGGSLFSCETGIHLQGLMADPATYEPFDPQAIGATRKIMIGKKAGRRSIAITLTRLGLPLPDEASLALITKHIRNLAAEYQRPLADDEIIRLATMA